MRRPLLILGSLDGVETGVRQLVRRRPLETELFEVDGQSIRAPTLEEMLRIKAWLVVRRNATRDYLDVVALAARLGAKAAAVVASMDDYYADQIGPTGSRVSTQVIKQLAEPLPYDLADVDLAHYRELDRRLRDWDKVKAHAQILAADVLRLRAGG